MSDFDLSTPDLCDELEEIRATRVSGITPPWSCICGQVYPIQRPMDFHAALKGTDGLVTKGKLRVRVFCTRLECGLGLIEVHYESEVVSR